MKKLFSIAVLGLILVSCKKTSSGGSGSASASATINDTSYSFNQQFQGYIEDNGKTIILYGISGTNIATAMRFTLVLGSNTAITPGVYSDTASEVDLPTISRSVYYVNVVPYISPSGPIDYNFTSIGLASNPFTVTVTSITPTSIQGTFSGNLYLDGYSTTAADSIKVITNGRFSAPLTINNN